MYYSYVMGVGNEIYDLCENLCDCKFKSIKDILKEDHYYSDKKN